VRQFLVTPFMPGGDLCDLILTTEDVPTRRPHCQEAEEVAKRRFREITLGLLHLHTRDIAHG
jgi:serine/threonine protein kinase